MAERRHFEVLTLDTPALRAAAEALEIRLN
jgi:hypothetical protein